MNKKDLKILAGNIVMESDYSNSAKKQLLNFLINEASEEQVKSLILDGDFDSLNEDAKNIVNKRFDNVVNDTLKESIEDTVEFINIGRETLCSVLESQDHDPETFEGMVNFVVNEASDYQILSMVMEETLPEDLNNNEKEISLIENLNTLTGVGFVPISEVTVGGVEADVDSLVNKLKSLGPGAAKAAIQQKLRIKQGILRQLRLRGKTATGAAGTAAALSAPSVKKPAPYWTPKAPEKIPGRLDLTPKTGPGMAGTTLKMKGAEEVPAMGARAGLAAKAKELATKGAKFAVSPTGQAIGAVAAAALIAYAAYKIYKNYFSKAATACKGATDKGVCMKQYKNKAIQAQISSLRSGSSKCTNTKDPAKCKAAIQSKISGLMGKIKS